ncbi:hypothetical protein ACFPOD_08080 [Nitratireductor kimnyeongensis]|uniref:TRAP-type C4-dicarboxylate transport system, substrate-binding protein n=1 Tax=Nitratireductor kimnyeongensis TaxID=430679 RepID=A0ABW0T9A8_9HYPH|nr:hypothetical protein [Nitratireductor kimnyeongensis]QZZ36445.1 hypothetical protein KW403_04675 [Nitratireductor kimnyeongensis]
MNIISKTAVSGLLLACMASSAGAEEMTLRASSTFGEGHVMWPHADAWMKEVSAKTNGDTSFQVFTWGELISAGQDHDGLMSGRADVSLAMLPAYERDRFPLSEVTLLPLTKSSLSIAMSAFTDLMNSDVEIANGKTYYQLEWEDQGMKALPTIITPEYQIAIVTPPESLTDNDALSRLRLRTAARTHDIYAKLIGANTISMPGGDMYDALSRGALDGNVISVADWSTYGFEEMFTASLSGISLGHYPGVIGFSKARWEEFSAETQALFETAAAETIDGAIETIAARTEANLAKNKDHGGIVVDVSDFDEEFQARYLEAVGQTWVEWIDAMESEGHPGRAIAILWRDLILKHGGGVPESVKDL